MHDVGADYLVMELVDGPTLAERIAHGPLPLDEALAIARQIGAALEAAHERGIVHRDLKPLQTAEATQEMTLTQAGAAMGTPSYMAPEQAQGKPVDKRADIWAFGVVLYEMLTGRRLFTGESVPEILAAVLTREPDWNAIPPAAVRLLRACLERDIKKRLHDIGDFPLLLRDGPLHGPPPAPASTHWRGRIALVGLAALSAALAFLLWRAPRDQPHRLMRFDASPGQYELAGQDALSPDGNRLAYVIRPQGGVPQLATRLLNEAAPALLAGTEGADSPFFSPDGQWIGFSSGRKIEKISVRGGPVAPLCDVQDSRGASWGPNGYIVANLMLGGGLFRVPDGERLALTVDRAEGRDIAVYDLRRQTMNRLTFVGDNARSVWSPDGKHIAFTTAGPQSESIRWVRADGAGEIRTLFEDKNELDAWSFAPDGRLAFSWIGADSSYHLWTLPLDLRDPDNPKPGAPERFLVTQSTDLSPSFSPDGRWVAYINYESGPVEVYVRPFPPRGSTDSAKWQISTGGGDNPIWSRTGSQLFYQTRANQPMVVDYAVNGNSFVAGKPRPWASKPFPPSSNVCCVQWNADLAPDGKRWVMFPIPPGAAAAPRVTVLLNFFDELRRNVR